MLTKVISNKTVFGDKEKVLETVMKDKSTEHFMYRVFGRIEGHEIGRGKHMRVNTETGEAEATTWTKFFGEFYAKNADGGDFEGATCFLPNYVSGQFVTALSDGGLGIEFGYDIYCIYDKASATSYGYLAQPIKGGEEKERSEAMKNKFLTALPMPNAKQIAAPKK